MSQLAARPALWGGAGHKLAAQSTQRALPARQPPSCRRRGALQVAAGKGFGKPTEQAKKPVEDGPAVPGQREERVKTVKYKGKRTMRQGPQSQAAQQAARDAPPQPGLNVLAGAQAPAAGEDLVEKIEFEQRLKALQAESEARRAEAQRAAAGGGGVLDTARQQREEDIYANVQPLSKSLLSRDDSGAAKEYEGTQFGPSQAALAAAAVLLGAVFLVTSGGPDVPGPSRQAAPGSLAQQQQLGEDVRRDLEQRLAEFQAQLEADGGDLDALESAAVVNARLGRYPEAEQQLARLAKERPGDFDVLRVLAEAQAAQGQWGPAASSYRQAWEAGGRGSLEVLQGLAGVLVADGKEAAAVEAVQAAQREGGSTIGAAELQLLAAKVYAQWRGHVPDALSVYDSLIESRPEDFRAYLAKGLLLQEQGLPGDAQRYFIQARYWAKEQKGTVDRIIKSREAAQQ